MFPTCLSHVSILGSSVNQDLYYLKFDTFVCSIYNLQPTCFKLSKGIPLGLCEIQPICVTGLVFVGKIVGKETRAISQ